MLESLKLQNERVVACEIFSGRFDEIERTRAISGSWTSAHLLGEHEKRIVCIRRQECHTLTCIVFCCLLFETPSSTSRNSFPQETHEFFPPSATSITLNTNSLKNFVYRKHSTPKMKCTIPQPAFRRAKPGNPDTLAVSLGVCKRRDTEMKCKRFHRKRFSSRMCMACH